MQGCVLFLMNALHSRTKYLLRPNLAITTCLDFAVSVPALILKQPIPTVSLPPSPFAPNLTTAIHFPTIHRNLHVFNTSRALLCCCAPNLVMSRLFSNLSIGSKLKYCLQGTFSHIQSYHNHSTHSPVY